MHSLVRSIQNPAVGKISIPVVYNVCVDFGEYASIILRIEKLG